MPTLDIAVGICYLHFYLSGNNRRVNSHHISLSILITYDGLYIEQSSLLG
ncbi:hypothetical protein H1P_2620004 [Hyella patelloides LEGE 07179]|uniref:Uncharacterized protein n=1 Tax=Hyella patelloides LEGE 07179 TaxID=945734 RepID=A0A563VSQ2_9CYAN|nr:hypothetical protein H1P_2570004 [Hyella patelloides LEGE 07179]VEP14416.1 hypothetical protein H1P_2620004 [Hyella patelloides LEGE 07179]